MGKGILEHLHSKNHFKCPELAHGDGREGLVGVLGLSLADCVTVTRDTFFSHSQMMLLLAASSEVVHVLTRSTDSAVLNWPEPSEFPSAGKTARGVIITRMTCSSGEVNVHAFYPKQTRMEEARSHPHHSLWFHCNTGFLNLFVKTRPGTRIVPDLTLTSRALWVLD